MQTVEISARSKLKRRFIWRLFLEGMSDGPQLMHLMSFLSKKCWLIMWFREDLFFKWPKKAFQDLGPSCLFSDTCLILNDYTKLFKAVNSNILFCNFSHIRTVRRERITSSRWLKSLFLIKVYTLTVMAKGVQNVASRLMQENLQCHSGNCTLHSSLIS